MKNLALIFWSAFLVNNIILIRLIGLCPCFGITNTIETSAYMGITTTIVMIISTWLTWIIFHGILFPLNLVYLRTASFILLIIIIVQLLEMLLKRLYRKLYNTLGIYLTLFTANCAILAVTFLITESNFDILQATIFAIGTGAGFAMVIIIFATLRERLEFAPVSPTLKGYPIAFLATSLIALAFLGFYGLFGIM